MDSNCVVTGGNHSGNYTQGHSRLNFNLSVLKSWTKISTAKIKKAIFLSSFIDHPSPPYQCWITNVWFNFEHW